MKIAYLNTSFNEKSIGGGSTHIREFINHVTALGHTIYVGEYNYHPKAIQIDEKIFPRIKTLLQCDVVYTRYEGKMTDSMLLNQFPLKQLTQHAVNIWEFNTLPQLALTKGKDEDEVDRQIKLLRKESAISDMAVCVSETMADYVKSVLKWKKVLVIPNGSNPDHFKPGLKISERMTYFEENFNIVWAGSLEMEWSDTELLIKTAEKFWASGYKNFHFHLIGRHPMFLSKRIPPNVSLYGSQPYRDLPNWLSGMDIGLILYKDRIANYGSPIKLFDYLSNGLAVISTQHPQVKKILSEIGFDDFVLNDDSSDELFEKIMKLSTEEELLGVFKENARKLINEKYNWGTSMTKLLNEIELLVNAK